MLAYDMVPQKSSDTRTYEPVDPQKKKDFARDQVRFLKEQGIVDPVRIDRIFRVAGPGQIQDAWKLANCTKDPVLIDVLDCLVVGAGGSQEFDWQRMAKVLERCGLYVPQVHTENRFFRILDGALEILFPGSYEFEDEEDVEQQDAE